MLTLVAPGPKLIAVRAAQQQVMVQYLTAHFMCEPMEQLGMGIDTTKTLCVLCVIDEQAEAQPVVYLGVAQPAEYVLCRLLDGDGQQMIRHIRALPPSIVFNSLGEHQPVVDKMQAEFVCERSAWNTLLYKENDEGVIVTFLQQEGPSAVHPAGVYQPAGLFAHSCAPLSGKGLCAQCLAYGGFTDL